jgi:hypothetical protein
VRKVEKVPAWLGRLSTEFANALKSALLPSYKSIQNFRRSITEMTIENSHS